MAETHLSLFCQSAADTSSRGVCERLWGRKSLSGFHTFVSCSCTSHVLALFLTRIMPFIYRKAKVCFLLCCSAPFEFLFLFCKSKKREAEENTNQPCSTALGVFLMLLYIQIKWTDTHVSMCMSHNWDWKKKGLSRQFIYVWKYINHTHNTHTYAYTGSNSKPQSQVWFGTTMFIGEKKTEKSSWSVFLYF